MFDEELPQSGMIGETAAAAVAKFCADLADVTSRDIAAAYGAMFLNMVDLLCDQYHYDFANLIAASDGDAAGSHLKDCIARRLFRAQSIAELKLVHELMSNEARR